MISRVNPHVRRVLVASRVAAMTRGLDEGLSELRLAHAKAVSSYDLAAIGLLESELLATNLQPNDGLRVFERQVENLLPSLDHRTASIIADNKAQLLMRSHGGLGDFYHLVDSRRILGVDLHDHALRLEAASNAAAGKHFEALPTYWQQLRLSYEFQNWRARRVAEADFSEECIQLGWLDEGAYHAMLAGKTETVERSAKALLASRSPIRITNALKRLVRTSSLREHALQTMRIIYMCADAIPDELLGITSDLLSKHASFQPAGWHDVSLFQNTWDAVRNTAHRFQKSAIREFIDAGLKHSILQRGSPARRHLIDGINALTAKASPSELSQIADVALKLVTDWRSDIDYTESINMLCHVAHRSDDEVRTKRLFQNPTISR